VAIEPAVAAVVASHRLQRCSHSGLGPKLRPRDIEAGYGVKASVDAILAMRGLGRVEARFGRPVPGR
jgi:hypothetical protein